MNKFCNAFISYGRADSKAFATKLYDRLLKEGLKVWFDQNDIPLGVDFQNQIDDGIEKGYNFLFIIAPHSVNSPYCGKEIELALKRNKRIIPLLHVEQITQETWQQRNPKGTPQDWEAYQQKGLHSSFPNMHPAIGKINWVYFREGIDDFDQSFAGLIDLLKRHADYVEKHTHFLARALEWERHQKQTSYLLVGEERQQAEAWLKIRFKDDQPPCFPSDLHCEYITESIKNANNLMTQVIISYADEDRATMEKIRKSLRRKSITVWTNTTDIQTGEAFEEAIKRGIEQADNVVYLLSPDSVMSDFARRELESALSLNKRIIPVLVREIPPEKVPSAVRDLHYIDLTDNVKEEDYQIDESQLLNILHQDEAYYNEHKILLTKALKWKRQHENPSILLRGYNLRSAETWLKVANKRTLHPPILLIEEFIDESLRQPPAESLDVFISYSRADSDLARKLNDELQLQGKRTWFDQESIASGADFAQEINGGIQACDNFLFILSPRSVNSPYCKDEVEYAAGLNKRFVTVLHREVNSDELHRELAKVQWIDFNQNQGDFNANFRQLVRTLDTDREHLRHHTKWSQRAIEWKEKNHSADLLLRGSEFWLAQNWLQETERQKKRPSATHLQQEYIQKSNNAILAERRREKGRLLILFLVSIISTASAIFAGIQWRKAEILQINALSNTSTALLLGSQELEAVKESVRAGQQMKRSLWQKFLPDEDADNDLKSNFQKILQRVSESNRLEDKSGIGSVAFSADDKMIATTSDGTVQLWKADGASVPWSHNGQKIPLASSTNDQKDFPVVATSADGQIVAVDNEGSLVLCFKTVDNDPHCIGTSTVAFNPTGKSLALAAGDRVIDRVILLSLTGDRSLSSLSGQRGDISAIAFSADGKTLATANIEENEKKENVGLIQLWNLADGTLINTLEGDMNQVQQAVAISPDGRMVAASGWHGATLWKSDGTWRKKLEGHAPETAVNSITFSPDGKLLATGGVDKTVKVWKNDGTLYNTLAGHNDAVWEVSFSPDSQKIASASNDNTVKLWMVDKATNGTLLNTFAGHQDVVRSVAFSHEGKMIASGSDEGTVKLWDLRGTALKSLTHNNQVYTVAFSPDGKTIATAWGHGWVTLWNRDGTVRKTEQSQYGAVTEIAFSPNSQVMATASGDRSVKLHNLDSTSKKFMEGKVLEGQTGDTAHPEVLGMSFSSDGKIIATANYSRAVQIGAVQLFNSSDGKLLKTLDKQQSPFWDVSFSPDGKTIAAASNDGMVKLWRSDGTFIKTLPGHEGAVHSVAFSPDGKIIATANYSKEKKSGAVQLFNSSDGKLLKTLDKQQSRFWDVSFSPDGKTIAAASDDGMVKLWRSDGTFIKTLSGHEGAVHSVAFSPDSKTIASASADRTVILWNWEEDLDLDQLLGYGCQWLRDYLKNNPKVEESDRTLCD
jgi:WD40 repeat protein